MWPVEHQIQGQNMAPYSCRTENVNVAHYIGYNIDKVQFDELRFRYQGYCGINERSPGTILI